MTAIDFLLRGHLVDFRILLKDKLLLDFDHGPIDLLGSDPVIVAQTHDLGSFIFMVQTIVAT